MMEGINEDREQMQWQRSLSIMYGYHRSYSCSGYLFNERHTLLSLEEHL